MSDIEERLPDRVMLADFRRLLEMGEDDAGRESDRTTMAVLFELTGFIDRHGHRLLNLAETCVSALERQSKEPT